MKKAIMDTNKKKFDLTQFYDDLSQTWDGTRPKYTTQIFQKIISHLNKSSSVLDFGCGTGLFCKYAQENLPDAKIEGIDISNRMIEKARTNCPSCQFYVGNILSTVLPKYDAIISKDVFNHISDISKTLSRLDELVNIGGKLVVANREREADTKGKITTALESLHYLIRIKHYSFKPAEEEIESFIKTLSGFDERHKQIVREKLLTCGNYYIIYAHKNS